MSEPAESQPMIAPYIHQCVVQSGPARGNKNRQPVTSFDIEYGERCEFCDEPLATPEQIVAHIYEELTNAGS